ncbi:MAG: uroporphyrinogen-III C-methyltransferase, partial [Methylococcaceae bacterium]
MPIQPLSDFTVLVTRPEGQSEALCRLIEEDGGRALALPLLEIQPVSDAGLAADLFNRPGGWDWLIFVSANAVRHALHISGWVELLGSTRIAAAGEATAAELSAAGLRVDLVPASPFNSEALLDDARMAEVRGQRILIVRGSGGREHLAEVLGARGAEVAYAELYRRVPVLADHAGPMLTLWRETGFDAVVITSGEALARLDELVRDAGLDAAIRTPLVVISARLAERAGQLGWRCALVAEQASDEALAQSLRQLAHAKRTGVGPLARLWSEPVVDATPLATGVEVTPPAVCSGAEPPETVSEPILSTHDATDRVDLSLQSEATPPEPNAEQDVMSPELPRASEPPIDEGQPEQPVPLGLATAILPEQEQQKPTAATAHTLTDGDTPLTEQLTENTAAIEPAPAPVEAAQQKPAKKRGGVAWFGYIILMLIVGIGAGGWYLLKELRARPELAGLQLSSPHEPPRDATPQISALQSEISSLHSQIATLQSQLATDDSRLERILSEHDQQFNDRIDAVQAEVGGAILQIRHQLNTTHGDLLIADAEYLLNVANQKLHLVGDVKAVLAAMEAADHRLRESGDPAVYKVREALAEEMAVLRKMNAPDLVGISAKLIALEKKVAGLPLVLPHAGIVKEHEKAKASAAPPVSEQGQEGDAVDAAIREFKDLVTVRRTDRPIEALLAPEQAEALRQMLLLKLETSRAALLRNDAQLFKDSLTVAGEWVAEHFDTTAAETRAMQDELAALSGSSLDVSYPDISKSMVMLQNIGKLRLEHE